MSADRAISKRETLAGKQGPDIHVQWRRKANNKQKKAEDTYNPKLSGEFFDPDTNNRVVWTVDGMR